ncbi:MAG: DUF4369 domain-containing protein [Prevotella sp.]|nr:DUF4369 domain-containing protein [Prevotella sp.]
MRRILFFLAALLAVCFAVESCKNNPDEGKCVIEGTINPRFNNKRIFLVPMNGPQDAAHVDSVVVRNSKFRFVKDTTELAVIRVDYHFRTGVQDLLLITEPGKVEVVIDSVSDCKGTPQNDSISKWKGMSAQFNANHVARVRQMRAAKRQGDTLTVSRMKAEIDSCYKAYKTQSRQLADNLKEGVLHDFLETTFPRTYKKRMPDGSIKTVANE